MLYVYVWHIVVYHCIPGSWLAPETWHVHPLPISLANNVISTNMK